MRPLRISWDAVVDANIASWRIYLSTCHLDKGERIAEVAPDDRTFTTRPLPDAQYHVRVLAVSFGGTEEDWQLTRGQDRLTVSAARAEPDDLVNPGAALVSGETGIRIVADPSVESPAHHVEVIRGPDEYRGQLVGTLDIPHEEFVGDLTGRAASFLLPALPGRRTGGGDMKLLLRPVTREGKRGGTAASVEVPYLDLPNHTPTVLASIVGTTLVGITAAVNTDPWETDATDGARLKEIPQSSDLTVANGWGTSGSGLFADNPSGARYLIEGVITTDEIDLGAVKTFVLECYDEVQRKTAAGALATIESRRLEFPSAPHLDPATADTTIGPDWCFRFLQSDGKPLRPLPASFWEHRIGDTTPLSGDWLPHVPGTRHRGRYVESRFTMSEPVGLHQLICPRAYMRAWVANDTRVIEKSGSDFGAGDLSDITTSEVMEIGIRTDAGNEEFQVNIGGTMFGVALAAL